MPPTSASSSSAVMASGSRTSALPDRTRQPERSATVASGSSARCDAATTARPGGGVERTVSRARPPPPASSEASRASAWTNRRVSASRTASTATPDGYEAAPTRRQRSSIRPISAAEVVAVPRSSAKNARASPVKPALRVPCRLFVDLLEPRDQQLDPGVVGQDGARAGDLAPEHVAQDRIEEQHRVGPEGPVRTARLEEVDGGRGQPA